MPECGYTATYAHFKGWQAGSAAALKAPKDALDVTGDITLTATWEIFFAAPDFVIPGGMTHIEDNAFEGIAATVVQIPANCASIGAEAFRDCVRLGEIRIPAGCAVGADAFAGCGKVYIFGAAGSSAEAYCSSHGNCVFVAE